MYWNFYFDLRVYVCFCVSMYTEYRSLLRPEVSSVGFIRAAIIGSCELLNMDAGGWNLLCQKEQPFPLSLPIFPSFYPFFQRYWPKFSPKCFGFFSISLKLPLFFYMDSYKQHGFLSFSSPSSSLGCCQDLQFAYPVPFLSNSDKAVFKLSSQSVFILFY